MRKIKPYVFAILVIMTVMCLSACKTTKKPTDGTTGSGSAATTQTTTIEGTKAVTPTGRTDENSKESTGVINGMINDVEKGVDNVTGESNGHPTSGAGMSSGAE